MVLMRQLNSLKSSLSCLDASTYGGVSKTGEVSAQFSSSVQWYQGCIPADIKRDLLFFSYAVQQNRRPRVFNNPLVILCTYCTNHPPPPPLPSQNLLRLRIWRLSGMRLKPTAKILLIWKRYVGQSCPRSLISQAPKIANSCWLGPVDHRKMKHYHMLA